MSEASVKHRAEMKAKAHRLANQEEGRVDASDYRIPGKPTSSGQHYAKVKESLTTPCDGKPSNPREYARGGLATGGAAAHHAGRAKRDMGGPTTAPGMNVPVNRMNFSPVPNRMGSMIQGAMGAKKGGWIKDAVKHPGALHKELGVPEGKKIPAKKLKAAEHSKNPLERKRANLAETLKGLHKKGGGSVSDGEIQGTRPDGGRLARKHGGRSGKGKTNIAIIIGAGHGGANPNVPPASMTQGPARPPIPPVPPPAPAMAAPMGGAPPMGGMPPQMPPQMPMRADGGRLVKPGKYPLDSGSGGGEGRLEKARAYGLKP